MKERRWLIINVMRRSLMIMPLLDAYAKKLELGGLLSNTEIGTVKEE